MFRQAGMAENDVKQPKRVSRLRRTERSSTRLVAPHMPLNMKPVLPVNSSASDLRDSRLTFEQFQVHGTEDTPEATLSRPKRPRNSSPAENTCPVCDTIGADVEHVNACLDQACAGAISICSVCGFPADDKHTGTCLTLREAAPSLPKSSNSVVSIASSDGEGKLSEDEDDCGSDFDIMNQTVACPICGQNGDEQHVDSCIDEICPESPPASPSRSQGGPVDSSWTLEDWLGPDLKAHAAAFKRAGFYCERDLRGIPDPADDFLRHECGIDTMGPRKKISKLLRRIPRDGMCVEADKERTVSLTGSAGNQKVLSARTSSKKPDSPFSSAGQSAKTWDIFSKGFRAGISTPAKRRRTGQISADTYPREKVGKAPRPPTKAKHPFSHRVPGTSFVVDSFRAAGSDGCLVYFLSHFHSDHYQTLRKSTLPAGAVVMCSAVTASLVHSMLRVPKERIQVLPSNGNVVEVPDSVEPSNGVSVQCYDANHCPGAVVLLFKVWKTKRWVLHTGDCRFDPDVFLRHSSLADVIAKGELDYLHLDTTYCDPRYVFPHQRDILTGVVEAARREDERTDGRCVFFFGTYSIGKEKVFMAVAISLDLKIYADKRKTGILLQLGIPGLESRLVDKPANARVHVVPMRGLNPDGVTRHARRAGMSRWFVGRGLAVIFRPTGWTFRSGGNNGVRRSVRGADQAVAYEVAYSEHSSFAELQAFVSWAKPARLIPTVNCRSAADVEKLNTLLAHKNRTLRSIS